MGNLKRRKMTINQMAIAALSIAFGLSAYYFSNLGYIKVELSEDHIHFTEFLAKYNKNFGDHSEFEKRFQTFKDNLRHVEEHNSLHGFKMGVNMFSDLTE